MSCSIPVEQSGTKLVVEVFLFLIDGLMANGCTREEAVRGLGIVNYIDSVYDEDGEPPTSDYEMSRKPYADLLRKFKPAVNLIMMGGYDIGNPTPVYKYNLNSWAAGITGLVSPGTKIFETRHPGCLINGEYFDELLAKVRRFQDYLQSIRPKSP